MITCRANIPIYFNVYFLQDSLLPEAYSDPCQSSEMELVGKKREWLKAVNYFWKMFHLGCLIGFWIHL